MTDSRAAFLAVQQGTADVEAQEKAFEVARKALEREAEKLKATKASLAAAWGQLERVTSHATVYNIDGQAYMRWVGHNSYPEPKLVLVTGFAIPPAEVSPAPA